MSTLKRFGKVRVVMWPGDHAPPHVHVLGPGFDLTVGLNTSQAEGDEAHVRQAGEALAYVEENRQALLAKWLEVNS